MAVKLKKDAQATRLPIVPTIDKDGNVIQEIPLVYLHEVSLTESEHSTGEFKGMTVPQLTFEFRNYKLNAIDKDRFHFHNVTIPASKIETKGTNELEDRPVDKVIKNIEDMWLQVKHIYDAFYDSPGYIDIIKLSDAEIGDALSIEESGDQQFRLDSFKRFATWIIGLFNGTPKDGEKANPIYIRDGKYLPAWLKLLPEYRQRKYYTLPTWVRHGIFELAKQDANGVFIPSETVYLEIDEDVKLMKPEEKAKTIEAENVTGAVSKLPPHVQAALDAKKGK